MVGNLYNQTVVALIWDFDKTLIPRYMQQPLFERFKVDESKFWEEVNGLASHYKKSENIRINPETIYLNHLLTYVQDGQMAGLSNDVLRECGAQIEFFPGLPEFFQGIREDIEEDEVFKHHGITVEHYIVSTGLRQMILGSAIAPFVCDVWGCEFIEKPASPKYLEEGVQAEMSLMKNRTARRGLRNNADILRNISQVAYAIDNTTKTRAVFEINKGSNVDDIDVNAAMNDEDRRVPFSQMIYVADGPSDVPVFSVLNKADGHTFGVYGKGSQAQFAQVKSLQEQHRIQSFAEADYSPGTQAALWLTQTATEIARRIVIRREAVLKERVQPPPRHIVERKQSSDIAIDTAASLAGPEVAAIEYRRISNNG